MQDELNIDQKTRGLMRDEYFLSSFLTDLYADSR